MPRETPYAPPQAQVSDRGGSRGGSRLSFAGWGMGFVALLAALIGLTQVFVVPVGRQLFLGHGEALPFLTRLTFDSIAWLWIFPIACLLVTVHAVLRRAFTVDYRRRAVRRLAGVVALGVLFVAIAWISFYLPLFAVDRAR